MLTIEADLNVVTGEVTDGVVDAYLPGRPPLNFVRSYSSRDPHRTSLGHGWRHNQELKLWRDGEFYFLGGGGAGDDQFVLNPETGLFTTNSGAYFLEFDEPFTFVKARNGSFWRFENRLTSAAVRLRSREDIDGNRIEYFYTGETLAGILG